jgi:hypothetical protein
MPMIAGAAIYKLRPHMTGKKLLMVIPIIPMADGIANGATAWPMWLALNQSEQSWVWTYLAGFVTLGLALFVVWIIGTIVAVPEDRARIKRIQDVWSFRYLGKEPAPAGAAEPPPPVREPVAAG